MPNARQTHTIPGKFTRRQLEKILGKPTWAWDKCEDAEPACGLSAGETSTAGWGTTRACCRIWIHKDGICLAPGFNVPEDIAYTNETYQKIKEASHA